MTSKQCHLNPEEYQSCLACNFCREKQYFQLKFFMGIQPKIQLTDYFVAFISAQLIHQGRSYNPGHNTLALFNNLAQIEIPTSKMILDIQYNKLGTRVASQVAERLLTLRVFRNQEILEKCQIWVEAQPSVQSSFQKLNFDKNCPKTRKIREQNFKALTNFTGFIYFVPNILSKIV